jgi:hypothetical protein
MILILTRIFSFSGFGQHYKNFKVSVYSSVNIVTVGPFKSLTDLITNEKIPGTGRKLPAGWGQELTDKNVFSLTLKPHSYRVFKFE